MYTTDEKYNKVINKNTFYYFDKEFEENYEGYIISMKETLLNLKNSIDNHGLTKSIFEELLDKRQYGLRALLALTGFSNENLKRIITVVRVTRNSELSILLYKDKWSPKEKIEDITEWGDKKILSLVKNNKFFRKAIVNLFFEGSSIPFLAKTLPLFELKKLSISKLKFDLTELIDTIIRYKEKGSYSGKGNNNPEKLIENIILDNGLTYQKGDLTELLKNERIGKRTMDFIIPNKVNPQIIIESSYLSTTSSGQGDKSKTESNINKLIRKYYPKSQFIGFVDGIGWYVRKSDLRRMVSAYDDVFTFHNEEIIRFSKLLLNIK